LSQPVKTVKLEYKLALLERYDTTSAIEVLKREIAKDGDTKLKLRLSVLGLALDRPELVEKELSSIPSVHEINPQMGIHAVQVLRARAIRWKQLNTPMSLYGSISMT
jgi:hypothetical protein